MPTIVSTQFREFITDAVFPCIAAKAAVAKNQLSIFEAGSMYCPASDKAILEFLYTFIKGYRSALNMYHSAVVIFSADDNLSEEAYEKCLWQRLQKLADLDATNFKYDSRVTMNPHDDQFSFSIMEEAFFIIGLHPNNSRTARQFTHPALVFNPHAQFEELRTLQKYERMKTTVRTRDFIENGSINPMLQDFGTSSEVYQYSGKQYDKNWGCPLNLTHSHASNSTENGDSVHSQERKAS